MKCYACGKLVSKIVEISCVSELTQIQGHISRDCTAPNGGPLNAAGKTCYKCGEPGHISRDCPSAETNGAPASSTPAEVAAAAPVNDAVPTEVAAPTAAVA
jgi:hypothetical protein